MWKLVRRLARLTIKAICPKRAEKLRPSPVIPWELTMYAFEIDWYVKVSSLVECVETSEVDVSIRFVRPNQAGSTPL